MPPYHRATSELIIKKSANRDVRFVATFKKTQESVTGSKWVSYETQAGTWRGVQILASDIQVKTQNIFTGKCGCPAPKITNVKRYLSLDY